MSYADNALMTKARASYGKRLRGEDYKHLVEAKTISEIVAYLKSDTSYSSALSEVQQDMVHRGQLENILEKRILTLCLKLLRFSYGDKLFLMVYTMRNEIDLLLLALRMLNAGDIDRFLLSLPIYMDSYLSLDLKKMGSITDYRDFLATLQRTPYFNIMINFRPNTSGQIDVVSCEKALLTYYYTDICAYVEKHYKGDVKKDLLDIFYTEIDTHNFLTVYRLKKHFGFTPEQIENILLNVPTKISAVTLNELAYASDISAVINILQRKSNLFKKYPVTSTATTEEISKTITTARLNQSRKAFRFSTTPIVVALSYMTLLEIESANITHLIEGTRYQVSPSEIHELLAY